MGARGAPARIDDEFAHGVSLAPLGNRGAKVGDGDANCVDLAPVSGVAGVLGAKYAKGVGLCASDAAAVGCGHIFYGKKKMMGLEIFRVWVWFRVI
jgi:hypothetical protein